MQYLRGLRGKEKKDGKISYEISILHFHIIFNQIQVLIISIRHGGFLPRLTASAWDRWYLLPESVPTAVPQIQVFSLTRHLANNRVGGHHSTIRLSVDCTSTMLSYGSHWAAMQPRVQRHPAQTKQNKVKGIRLRDDVINESSLVLKRIKVTRSG